MKTHLINALTAFFLFLMPIVNFGQAPDLGAASNFALFTSAGAFTNEGASVVTGDIGTYVGALTGFPPGTVIGDIYYEGDPIAFQAAAAVNAAYLDLSGRTCGFALGTPFGNGQTLLPGVHCIGSAATLEGELILDALGDPDALFIIQIGGALATSVNSSIILAGSASLDNVFWQVGGAFTLGDNSVFRGTIVANGQIELLEGSTLYGRGLTRAGAILLHNNIVNLALPPVASIITANGPTTFCEGGSVILSGNVGGIWSTGETTESITVTTSGDFFVTNTNEFGTVESNHIIVTVNPLPVISISGETEFCQGESTILTATAGVSYLWNTNATTQSQNN